MSISKRAYDISFFFGGVGVGVGVGRESSTARKVTPTSKAKGMQRAHGSPATPNFNLVSQPRVIKTAKGDGSRERG